MLVLDCAPHRRLPRFPFANVGGDSCDVTLPRVMDQDTTRSWEGQGTFEVPLSGSALIVENALTPAIGTLWRRPAAGSTPVIAGLRQATTCRRWDCSDRGSGVRLVAAVRKAVLAMPRVPARTG